MALLIDKYQLQAHVKAQGAYSAAEVQLILNKAFQCLPTGTKAKPLLQIIALVQLCFLTGICIGSLVASDKTDESKPGMQHHDVSFTTPEPGAWTLYLNICHIKG